MFNRQKYHYDMKSVSYVIDIVVNVVVYSSKYGFKLTIFNLLSKKRSVCHKCYTWLFYNNIVLGKLFISKYIMRKLLNKLPASFILPLFIIGGVICGLGGYLLYISRAYTYMTDNPSACINCHIMTPYYQSWMHSSHSQWTTCNDCHLPQDNVFNKYAFKAVDGLYHSAVFTLKGEPQVIRARDASSKVIMNNCIRCHTQLNTEFVNTGMIEYVQVQNGEGKACWDCHREVPHTVVSNLSSSPNVIAPMPQSPVPTWLKEKMKQK